MPTPSSKPPGERAGLPADFFADAVELLTRLTRQSSPSDDPAGLRAMARMLAAELAARGLKVEICDQPDEHGVPLPVIVAETAADDADDAADDADDARSASAG
ncbi:MAG: hypothetical protein ABIV06_12275, partial [Thermoanaerobaculia bacterium]